MERRLREKVANLFELPGDVVLDISRITLTGAMQMLVENHRGLVEYNPGRVTLGVPRGEVTIEGEDLLIGSISPEEITITGRITGLRFSTSGA